MHQTFYIEADEEISSVIDKLRKSFAVDNYFVVTKRALVVQSIVNLKLLKREAEKFKKNIILVATDEQIIKMAERIGIKSQSSMEGLDFTKTSESTDYVSGEKDISMEKKKRLIKVGSDEYYQDSLDKKLVKEGEAIFEDKDQKNIHEDEAVARNLMAVKPPVKSVDNLRRNTGVVKIKNADIDNGVSEKSVFQQQKAGLGGYDIKKSFEEFIDPEKERKMEKMFSHSTEVPKRIEKREVIKSSNGIKNSIFIMMLAIVVVFIGIAGYLILPRAEAIVYLESENKKLSLNVTASLDKQEIDVINFTIPGRLLEIENEMILVNDVTGASGSAGQKAKGTVVVYNEYSDVAQPLVATTRLETEDGKIFRLAKGVSVPGMTSIDGKKQPGIIEVEVIADAVGDIYNIESSSFKVPGFKGTDKYDKFYAKSVKQMTGGGLSADAVKMVTKGDIDAAKNKTENALKEKIITDKRGELGGDEILLENSLKLDIISSNSLSQEGDLKNSLEYQVKAKAMIFAVSRKDVESLISKFFMSDNEKTYEYVINQIDINFENIQADFENKKVNLRIDAQVKIDPVFDQEAFKNKLLAKNEEQIREIMNQYPQIKNLEINVNPAFISVTPRFNNRIKLKIESFNSQ